MTISGSKLDLTRHCPGWLALPHVEEKHDGQDEGNERDRVFTERIRAGDIPEALAARWPGATWRAQVAYAWNWTNDTARELPPSTHRDYTAADPMTEVCMTLDAVGLLDDLVLVVDFKSYDPLVPRAAVNGQIHLGALAACRTLGIDAAEVAIHHEARAFDVATVTWVDLETFAAEAKAIVMGAFKAKHVRPLKLSTGVWCRYCPAFSACPRQSELTALVKTSELDMRVEAQVPLTDENAADFYDLWKRVDLLAKRMKSVVYARAAERGITLSNGNTFGRVISDGDRVLDGDKAYALIREKYGQEMADKAVTREATQTGLTDALKAAGEKSVDAKVKAFVAELDKLGGVTRKPSSSIKELPFAKLLKVGGQ